MDTRVDTPATSRKRPAFSPLNAEARQPTASVGRISPPRVRRRLALGLHPPPTNNNGVMLYRKGGRNRERNCRIPRISPPLRFVLRLRLQKEGGGGRICGTLRYLYLQYKYREWYSEIYIAAMVIIYISLSWNSNSCTQPNSCTCSKNHIQSSAKQINTASTS